MIEHAPRPVDDEPLPVSSMPAGAWLLPFVLEVAAIGLLLLGAVVGYARVRTGSIALVWPYLRGERLLFEPARLALGEVPRGEIVEREVRVVNLSSGELRLLGSQKTCGCIALDDFPIKIAPGEERRLRLKIGVPREAGRLEHYVRVFSDDKRCSSIVIKVCGMAR
jgi:hypothetical protein